MWCVKEEAIPGREAKRRVKLISDTVPTSLNITGADVGNIDDDIVFAVGSYLLCLADSSIYIKSENGGFVKWEV